MNERKARLVLGDPGCRRLSGASGALADSQTTRATVAVSTKAATSARAGCSRRGAQGPAAAGQSSSSDRAASPAWTPGQRPSARGRGCRRVTAAGAHRRRLGRCTTARAGGPDGASGRSPNGTSRRERAMKRGVGITRGIEPLSDSRPGCNRHHPSGSEMARASRNESRNRPEIAYFYGTMTK